jgi:hypothetical protein
LLKSGSSQVKCGQCFLWKGWLTRNIGITTRSAKSSGNRFKTSADVPERNQDGAWYELRVMGYFEHFSFFLLTIPNS